MNAMIRKVSGTYSVVQFVPDDKLDQLASLLGLDAFGEGEVEEQRSGHRRAGRRRQVRGLNCGRANTTVSQEAGRLVLPG